MKLKLGVNMQPPRLNSTSLSLDDVDTNLFRVSDPQPLTPKMSLGILSDLNGDGTTSPLEAGIIGSGLTIATGLAINHLRKKKKKKDMSQSRDFASPFSFLGNPPHIPTKEEVEAAQRALGTSSNIPSSPIDGKWVADEVSKLKSSPSNELSFKLPEVKVDVPESPLGDKVTKLIKEGEVAKAAKTVPEVDYIPGRDPSPYTQSNPSLLDSVKQLADLNGDEVISPTEGGIIGAGAALASLALGAGIRHHRKNNKMKNAVKAYAQRYPNSKLAKAAGFSEDKDFAVNLTDADINRFKNARTNFVINEGMFPGRKAKKFKFDVERQVRANEIAAKNPEVAKKLAEIDVMNRKGNHYFPAIWYNNTGAMYHTPKKAVKALTKIVEEDDFSELTEGKKIAFQMIGMFPKANTEDAKNAYWDAVNAIAKLPKEERERVYDEVNQFHQQRGAQDLMSSAIGYGGANSLYQESTISDKYRILAETGHMPSMKSFSEKKAGPWDHVGSGVLGSILGSTAGGVAGAVNDAAGNPWEKFYGPETALEAVGDTLDSAFYNPEIGSITGATIGLPAGILYSMYKNRKKSKDMSIGSKCANFISKR